MFKRYLVALFLIDYTGFLCASDDNTQLKNKELERLYTEQRLLKKNYNPLSTDAAQVDNYRKLEYIEYEINIVKLQAAEKEFNDTIKK